MTESDYSYLVRLFLELRQRGMSVSSADLDILQAWEAERLNPEFIKMVMLEYAKECDLKAKKFPTSLLPVARKIRAILIKKSEC